MKPQEQPGPTDPTDEFDVEGHAIDGNVNETVVRDEPGDAEFDVEGHAIDGNVNETPIRTPTDRR